MSGQVVPAPVGNRCRPEDKIAGTCIVRNELRRTGGNEIAISRIRNFDRRVHGIHGSNDFVDRVRGLPRRKITHHAKREFGLSDVHDVICQRHTCPGWECTLFQQTPCQRTIDTNVLLPRLAGCGDFPAEHPLGRQPRDLGLDLITFDACLRPICGRDCFDALIGMPGRPDGPGGFFDCLLFHLILFKCDSTRSGRLSDNIDEGFATCEMIKVLCNQSATSGRQAFSPA